MLAHNVIEIRFSRKAFDVLYGYAGLIQDTRKASLESFGECQFRGTLSQYDIGRVTLDSDQPKVEEENRIQVESSQLGPEAIPYSVFGGLIADWR